MKLYVGILLAFSIGVTCRRFGVPLPAPPVLIGALLVVAMSAGYIAIDRFARPPAENRSRFAGKP